VRITSDAAYKPQLDKDMLPANSLENDI